MSSGYDTSASQEPIDARIARVAASSFGVFSLEQALRAGATKSMIHRRLSAGRWARLSRGVYRLGGAPRTWRADALAACLACSGTVAISHRASARVRGIAGFDTARVELTTTPDQRIVVPGAIVHRGDLPAMDIQYLGPIPVTTVARTLIDLAAVIDEEALEIALDDALRQRIVSIPRLEWRLRRMEPRGRAGIGALRELVQERPADGAAPKSPLETRVARFLRAGGFPPPELQYRIADGSFVALVDFAYPDLKIALEADGYMWHTGKRRYEHDLARRTRLGALGWIVLHVTDRRLDEDPEGLAAELRAALERRQV